jgi:Na+/alanine symporter
MGVLDKLKSRTEWQAYLVTLVTLFLDHFLGWEMTGETLTALVASSGAYGVSRGLAKTEVSNGHSEAERAAADPEEPVTPEPESKSEAEGDA